MQKTLIIFDVDNTMFYTIQNVFKKINNVLGLFGKSISYDDFTKIFKNDSEFTSFIDTLSNIYNIDSDVILEKYSYFGKIINYKPIGNLRYIFNDLVNKGYKLGILTNGLGYITYKKLLSVNVNPFIFDFIIHKENNLYPKPSNNVFNIQLKSYLSKYSNIYMVGDSFDDYSSTIGTLIKFYGVTTGFYTIQDFNYIGINDTLDSIIDISKLF